MFKRIVLRLKKVKSLSWYVNSCILIIILFTVYCLAHDVQNDTLITCVFATFGGETLVCGVIKMFKLKKEI